MSNSTLATTRLEGILASALEAVKSSKRLVWFLLVFRIAHAAELPPAKEPVVGNFGLVKNILIEGNKAFSKENIRSGLQGSVDFLLAAHPSAPLAEFMIKLPELAQAGYVNAGFPDAKVTARRESQNGQPMVRIDVIEGVGFINGEIKIEGAEPGVAKEIVAAMTTQTREKSGVLATQIVAQMWVVQKPKAEARAKAKLDRISSGVPASKLVFEFGSKDPAVKAANSLEKRLANVTTPPESKPEVAWKPGGPASFGAEAEKNLASRLRVHLAERGYPQYDFTCRIIRGASKQAEAVVVLRDAGPHAIIGKIQVTGNKNNKKEDIISHLGLKTGQPYRSSMFQESMLALWNCGRFVNFWVTPEQRAAKSAEIDLEIEVTELPDATPLSGVLTPEQAALLKMAQWVNTSFSSGGRDLLFSGPVKGGSVEIAMSRDGLLAGIWQKADDVMNFHIDEKGVAAAGKINGVPVRAVASLNLTGTNAKAGLVISKDDNGKFQQSIDFGAGFSSLSSPINKVEFLINPATTFLKYAEDSIKIRDGHLIWKSEKGSLIESDAVTGELIQATIMLPATADDTGNHGKVTLRFAAGASARLEQNLQERRTTLAASEQQLITIAPFLTDTALGLWFDEAEYAGSIKKAQKSLSKVISSGLVGLLASWLDTANQPKAPQRSFNIPVGSLPPGINWMAYVMAAYSGVISEIFPANSWSDKLNRELFYIVAGDTRYTATALEDVFQDPLLGPLGSFSTAQLLEKFQPDQSARFLQRAMQHSSLEDFRNDYRMILAEEGPLAKSVVLMFQAIGDMTPEQADALVGLTPDSQHQLLSEALDNLRKNRQTSLMERLGPYLDRLWTAHWQPAFRKTLARRIQQGSLPDAVLSAAVVNGEAVPRPLVAFLENHQEILGALHLVSADLSLSKKETALSAAIDLTLSHQLFFKQGGTVKQEVMTNELWKIAGILAESSQADVTEALKHKNLSREGALRILEMINVFAALSRNDEAAIKPPTDEEVTAHMKSSTALSEGGTRHVHMIRIPKNQSADDQRKLAESLRNECLGEGNFEKVWKRYSDSNDAQPMATCYSKLEPKTLHPSLDEVAFRLKTGEVSDLIVVGDLFCILCVMPPDTQGAPKDDLQARNKAARELISRKLQARLREGLNQVRANSKIEIITDPSPDLMTLPPAGKARRFEAEKGSFEPAAKMAGNPIQKMTTWGEGRWSGGEQAFFPTSDRDVVTWMLEIDEAGTYDLTLQTTRAPDYGRVQIELDGVPMGSPIDLYAPGVQPGGSSHLGAPVLTRGTHRLAFKIVGHNLWSTGTFFGIDALDVTRRQ